MLNEICALCQALLTASDLAGSRNDAANAARLASKTRLKINIHQLAPRAVKINVSSMTLWQTHRKTSTSIKSLLVKLPSLAKEMITPEPKTIPKKRPANSGNAALVDRLKRFMIGWINPTPLSSRRESVNNANKTIKGTMMTVIKTAMWVMPAIISLKITGQSNLPTSQFKHFSNQVQTDTSRDRR